jgi:hypothetical protein
MTEPVLTLAWLVFAHLVADFVLQNDWIAMNKGAGGRTGWSALLAHGGHVSLCLLPAVLAFGLPGLAYLALVGVSHVLVDRWKVRATKRAEAAAQAQARKRLETTGTLPDSGLGTAWTPMPGLLFLADQVLHLTIAIVGWVVLLEGAALLPPFVDFANAVIRGRDPATVHAVLLTGVVLVSLFIVNIRGAFYFVMAMASPRELAGASASTAAPSSGGTSSPPAGTSAAPPVVPAGAPARVAAAIAALERLLIVAFILSGAELAIGFVLAVDLVARFRLLEDRRHVEHYLMTTLASVSVAIGTGLLAQAALHSLG